MKYRRAAGWVLQSSLATLLAASCDSQDDLSQLRAYNQPSEPAAANGGVEGGASGCVPGQTQPCFGVCQTFGLGYQICAEDGRSYGACVCPEVAPIATTGGSDILVLPPRIDPGSQVPVDIPGGSPVASRIGASCTRDSECGQDLDCFGAGTDSLGVGGPAGGYCTTRCVNTADCTAIDRPSTCGSLGGQRLCLRSCRSQTPAEGVDKCLSRPDLTCVSAAALGDAEPTDEPQFGICTPRCQSDEACAGRSCDLATGLCTDQPRVGDPIGSACDAPDTCGAGLCVGAAEESTGFCSAFCTVGVDGCGFDGSEAVIGAACILPQVPSEGEGDRGLCFELCDTADDCSEPGFTCVPEPTRGRAGACLPPSGPAPSGPAPGDEGLGLPCEADEDCPGALTCLTNDSDPFGAGGGPAQGYCTLPCEVAEDCSGGGVCATTPGGGFCLRGCDESDPDGCGRDTSLCVNIGGIAACVPNCTEDAECGERACAPDLGLCVDAPPSAECAADEDCSEGVCDVALGECVPEPEPEPECAADEDCSEGVCDVALGECVAEPEPEPEPECAADEDCSEGVCEQTLGECVPASEPECAADSDCAEGVCDVAAGACVEASTLACLADDDCAGQVCDVIDGICVEPPPQPIGSACSEDVQCAGDAPPEDDTRLCLAFGSANLCSAVCLFGTPLGCEAYGTDAFCVYPIDDSLGVCLELCNAPEDCQGSGFDCVALGTTINGRGGACLPPP